MPKSDTDPRLDGSALSGPQNFTTTRWSVVLASGDGQSAESTRALDQLCRTYWYPLYLYLRKQGRTADDAQDITQGFLSHLLQRGRLQRVAPEKGRFRSFLLASLGHFLCDQLDKERALKRGGGAPQFSWDALEAEERFQLEPANAMDPAKAFERRWALTLLDHALDRLTREHADPARRARFERLRPFLTDTAGEDSYAHAGRELGMSEGAVKVAVLRLRQRFRVIFREEIAETVSDEAELEAEMRHIFALLSG